MAPEYSTSPLSSSLSDISAGHETAGPPLQAQHEVQHGLDVDAEHDEEEVCGVASPLNSAIPTPASEISEGEDGRNEFQCRHCDKSYPIEKSFKVGHSYNHPKVFH